MQERHSNWGKIIIILFIIVVLAILLWLWLRPRTTVTENDDSSAFGGITTMQEMTSEICDAAEVGATKKLQDTRDGKWYWIAKQADNKCWMTQNLDLDLSTSTTLTSADTNVTSDYTPGQTTSTSVFNSYDNTGQYSYDPGDYYWNGNYSSSSIGTGTVLNEHYHVGNYYQWCAATAGSCSETTSSNVSVSASICPAGWKLPTGGTNSSTDFSDLQTATSYTYQTITESPLYFPPAGIVNAGGLDNAGYSGYYWSSTSSSSSSAYSLYFDGNGSLRPGTSNGSRDGGRSVRCVAS